jgi:hypothetical protein
MRIWGLRILLVTLCGWVLNAENAHSQDGRFIFSPPDTVNYSITVSTVRARSADTAKVTIDSAIVKGQGQLLRTKSGFQLREKNISLSMRRDGQQVDDPMLKLLTGLTILTDLDSLGFATAVRGYEAITTRIDSSLPPDQAAAVKRVVKPEAVADRDLDEWNRRMIRLLGRQVAIGTLYFDTTSIALPNGQSFPAYCATHVRDTVRMGNVLCVRMLFTTDLTLEGLSSTSGLPIAALAQGFPDVDTSTAAVKPDAEMHTRAETLVELPTMLIRGETSNRKLRFFMLDRANKKVPINMDETITKTYTYVGR